LVADLFVPPLPRLPEAGELLHVDDFLLSVGGCAANTAVDLARLGGSATVFGKVGQDLFGDFVVQELARQGAETDGITRSARQPTSRTMILPVAGENRRYIHSVGARTLSLHSPTSDLGRVFDARILYVGGVSAAARGGAQSTFRPFDKRRRRGMATVLGIAGAAGRSGGWTEVLPAVNRFLPTGTRRQHSQASTMWQNRQSFFCSWAQNG
jgi:sugar/nucleoside kinase (ribokinase family)